MKNPKDALADQKNITGLGYGFSLPPEPAGPEMVEISLDELDSIKPHYPNFGVEAYGPRPASDEPIHFVHADKVKMMEKYGYEPDPETRIAVVFYHGGKPYSAKILKSVWEKINGK